MKRLLVFTAIAGTFFWWRRRQAASEVPRAVIGYDDGSSLTLEDGSPGLDGLVALARGALPA